MADPQAARQVRSEIADVFLYLTRLADVLGVDLLGSAADKLKETSAGMTPQRTAAADARHPR